MITKNLTPAEADALLTLLKEHVSDFMDCSYTPELLSAIRKLRVLAPVHVYVPSVAGLDGHSI